MRASLHTLFGEWRNLLRMTFARCDLRDSFYRIVRAYSEDGRHYHTIDHIDQCLGVFQYVRAQANNPHAVAYAIWFHDMEYVPGGTENKYRSAMVAEGFLRRAHLDKFIAPVWKLIEATEHHQRSDQDDVDTAIMIDIDLSILGAEPIDFYRYELQLRREKQNVPIEIYQNERAEYLERMLDTYPLYRTNYCYKRFEKQARLNLADSLRRLRE